MAGNTPKFNTPDYEVPNGEAREAVEEREKVDMNDESD